MKPSCKKLREFIRDEEKDTKKYERYGLPRLSKAERGHRRFLSKKLRKECQK